MATQKSQGVVPTTITLNDLTNQIEAAKAILDFCSTVAPPIVTLILGFYFGAEHTYDTES